MRRPKNVKNTFHFFGNYFVNFVFSKKATKIDEIFTINLTLCSKGHIDGEDFVNFCGLLRKHEVYVIALSIVNFILNDR